MTTPQNPLVDASGNLTAVGYRANYLYNYYVSYGLKPMAAAQLVGSQLVEAPRAESYQVAS